MAYGVNAPFGLRPLQSINGGSWTEKVNEYLIYTNPAGTTTYANSIFTGDPVVWGTSIAATPQTLGGPGTIAVYNPNYTDGTPATFAGVGAAPILGVFMGCEYMVPAGAGGSNSLIKSSYWPGGTQVLPGSLIKAYVIDDPTVIYDIQVSTNIDANNANVFVANPVFPNTNGTTTTTYGAFGSNFALMIGGGTNFTTVPNPRGGFYTNNPATGNTLTGQSSFYLDINTSTAAGNNHDYLKNVVTLPLRALFYTRNPNNIAAPGLTIQTTPFINVAVTINNPVYAIGSAPTVYVG